MCPLAFSSYLQAPVPFIIGEGVEGGERGEGVRRCGGGRDREGERERRWVKGRGVEERMAICIGKSRRVHTHTHTHTRTQVLTASILMCLRSQWRCVW